MVIPKINSAHGSDTRNIINRTIDLTNAQGKAIQDLVAKGQLTPEQYARFVQILNNLIPQGEVSVNDIDLNKGKITSEMLDDALAQAIAGTAPINAVPSDRSITSRKLANKSVSINHIDPALISSFDGFKSHYARNAPQYLLRSEVDVSSVDIANKDIQISYEYYSPSSNIESVTTNVWAENPGTRLTKIGETVSFSQDEYLYYSTTVRFDEDRNKLSIFPASNVYTSGVFVDIYIKNIKVKIGSTVINVDDLTHYAPVSGSVTERVEELPKRLVQKNDLEIYQEKEDVLTQVVSQNNATSASMWDEISLVSSSDIGAFMYYQFDINPILSKLTGNEAFEVYYDLFSDSENITGLTSQVHSNNDSNPIVISGGTSGGTASTQAYNKSTVNSYYHRYPRAVNKTERYIKIVVQLKLANKDVQTQFYLNNVKLRLGDQVLNPVAHANNWSTYFTERKAYAPFSLVTHKSLEETLNQSDGAGGKWYGKVWNALGDSITEDNFTSEKQYHTFIAEKLNMTVRNYGMSGTGYAYRNNSPDSLSFAQRHAGMHNSADLVTVFGGTNDFRYTRLPLGTIDDTTDATFLGCVNITMLGLIEKYPDSIIAAISPLPRDDMNDIYTNDSELKVYADSIQKVAEKYSIPYLNLFTSSNIYPLNSTHKTKYIPDGLHPNTEGHKRIADKIQAFLETL